MTRIGGPGKLWKIQSSPLPEFRDDARQQPERCDDRHSAWISGLTFETMKALISEHPAFAPKLTV
jgi:hypothetical protein